MRASAWVGLAAIAAVSAIAACGGGNDEPAAAGGAGSTSGGGGQGGGGGKAGKGASAGAASGGTAGATGGAGASAGAAGTGGAEGLTWTASATFVDCGLSVGLPSPKFRLFAWKDCVEQPNCEEAVWTIPPLPSGRAILANVVDDDLGERLVLTAYGDPGGPEYRTDSEGWVASAIRSEGTCVLQFTSEFQGHIATGLTGGPDGA